MKRLLVCSLAVALCCPVVADDGSPALAQQALAEQAAKPPPFAAAIAAFEAADREKPPPKGAVLFIGSSSIRLWETLAKDFPELTVINRGFGGSQIADSVRYAPRIVIPHQPGMIVLYAGGNDLNVGKTPDQVLKDFQAFVDAIRPALPETRIVYVSINPSVRRWAQEPQVLEANRLIASYIREQGKPAKLSYVDSHSKLLSAEGMPRPEILRADGLHLNATGYRLWTEILKPQLLKFAARDKD